jgi:NADPH2:quinone reductase
LVKNITVEGFYWGGYLKFKPHVITDSLAKLTGWYQEGKLTPHISATFSLAEAQKGIDLLKARKSTGKVVITID